MAKPRSVLPFGSTFAPEKSIQILEKRISDAEELREVPWDSPKRQRWANTGEGALIAALGRANPAFQAFRSAQCGISSIHDPPETKRRRANEELDSMLAAIESAVEQLRWQLDDPNEVFFPSGSFHNAYKELRKIVEFVEAEIIVVDPYVDETLWTLLTNVSASAKIRVLTMQMKPDFSLEGQKFVSQHGYRVELRKTASYHDRFVIVDRERCWHLGTSINHAGNKAFAISEFTSTRVQEAIRADVEATWNSATVVPL
jgi:hypothetical protein